MQGEKMQRGKEGKNQTIAILCNGARAVVLKILRAQQIRYIQHKKHIPMIWKYSALDVLCFCQLHIEPPYDNGIS